MVPKYPIYIVSKGRWESRLTSKCLEKMNVPYHIVIEPQEYEQYSSVIDPSKILILPFSNLGQGSIPARNWIWQHSINEGHSKHWILDDNIRAFYILNNNMKWYADDALPFIIMEDFTARYINIALSGPQYEKFAPKKAKHFPFAINTRIYSCILIRNDVGERWRGRYNEDTDLSLRLLKQGWCTVLFYAALAEKQTTMLMKGGNTDELYAGDGRLKMVQSLVEQHPDIVTITHKWGRYQHKVDYSGFKQTLIRSRDQNSLSDRQWNVNYHGSQV